VTPHERRVRELEALRGLIADCERHIAAGGDIATVAVAESFERRTAALPEDSQFKGPLERLATKLRHDASPVIAESRLRGVVASLRPRADDLGKWVERREAKLRDRR
jgi:hypothetical protein